MRLRLPTLAIRRVPALCLALLLAALPLAAPTVAQQPPPGAGDPPLRLLGEYAFESNTSFQETTVGGLSGITYDRARAVYYAVSDDRGENQAPRFYTLRIGLSTAGISGFEIVGVTTLDSDASTPGIQPYERNDSDLEDITLLPDDTLLISSERDRAGRPWIRQFALDGTLLDELPMAQKYLPASQTDASGRAVQVRGVRPNLGFEPLAWTPDGALYTANEEALVQDGPIASLSGGTNVRLLRYDLSGASRPRQTGEWVYQVEPIFAAPVPANQFADNGVTAMAWIRHLLPEYDLLVMERSFSSGVGNDVNIYGVRLAGAQDVSALDALPNPYTGRAVDKTLLANMAAVGVAADNLEGMTLGPLLPNGRPSLVLVSDDNFSAFDPPQVNQFLLFEVNALLGK